jgi:2-amino-4-hydroxy-6-hydroxymethyldihydropteridine diphosphokinase
MSVAPDDSAGLDAAVVIALGGNDKGGWPDLVTGLEAALARLPEIGLRILRRSGWWASAAWPDPADPPFLNGVALVETALEPEALMAALAGLEAAMGRVRSFRNAPRTLDLDLIAYGRRTGRFGDLILPHPRAADRLFVMGPLAEIAPAWRHPETGEPAVALARVATVGTDARPIG